MWVMGGGVCYLFGYFVPQLGVSLRNWIQLSGILFTRKPTFLIKYKTISWHKFIVRRMRQITQMEVYAKKLTLRWTSRILQSVGDCIAQWRRLQFFLLEDGLRQGDPLATLPFNITKASTNRRWKHFESVNSSVYAQGRQFSCVDNIREKKSKEGSRWETCEFLTFPISKTLNRSTSCKFWKKITLFNNLLPREEQVAQDTYARNADGIPSYYHHA